MLSSTLDSYARVVRAVGVSPPVEFMRGKTSRRLLMLNRPSIFRTARAIFACSLEPSFGKVMYLSFEPHDCPTAVAEAMEITENNRVYIASNTTLLFADSSVSRQLTIDVTTDHPLPASARAISLLRPFKNDEIRFFLADLADAAHRAAPIFDTFDMDGWCEHFRVPYRCYRTVHVAWSFVLCVALCIAAWRRVRCMHLSSAGGRKGKRRKRVDDEGKPKTSEPARVTTMRDVARLSVVLHHVMTFVDNARSDPVWRTVSSDGWIPIESMLQTPTLKKLGASVQEITHVMRNDVRFELDTKGSRVRKAQVKNQVKNRCVGCSSKFSGE